jgi:Tfp pilus assembly protein PilF
MGHGGSVLGREERVLFFETDDGSADPVTGTDLVNKLADFPTLRLVVLNACGSATLPDGAGADPLTGVASSLVLGGMPSVVAMQFPISDESAIKFSHTFYQRCVAGDPVEAAVAEGRQAIHSADRGGIEWAAPVLFLRGHDLPPEQSAQDVLEQLARERRARKRKVRWLTAAFLVLLAAMVGGVGRYWWVERLVAEGVAFFEHEKWPEARERFQAALKLAPSSAEVLSNLAATEERLGDVRAAENHYREAVMRRPESAEHLFNLGHFLNSRGRYHDAYLFLLQAAVSEPARVDAYGELAHAALGLGMLGRARVALSTALHLDPERPALHRLYGEVELRAGQPQAAISHLEEARSRYTLGELGRIETSWLLIQAYDRLDNVPSACQEIYEFRRLDGSGVTPWAPLVEAVAARSHCPSR